MRGSRRAGLIEDVGLDFTAQLGPLLLRGAIHFQREGLSASHGSGLKSKLSARDGHLLGEGCTVPEQRFVEGLRGGGAWASEAARRA